MNRYFIEEAIQTDNEYMKNALTNHQRDKVKATKPATYSSEWLTCKKTNNTKSE